MEMEEQKDVRKKQTKKLDKKKDNGEKKCESSDEEEIRVKHLSAVMMTFTRQKIIRQIGNLLIFKM